MHTHSMVVQRQISGVGLGFRAKAKALQAPRPRGHVGSEEANWDLEDKNSASTARKIRCKPAVLSCRFPCA
jgi:hypothetical protein